MYKYDHSFVSCFTELTIKLKTKFSRFLDKQWDLCKVVLYFVCGGLAFFFAPGSVCQI